MTQQEQEQILGRLLKERSELKRRLPVIREALRQYAQPFLHLGSALTTSPERVWVDPHGDFIGNGQCFRSDAFHFGAIAALTEELREAAARLERVRALLTEAGFND